MSALSAHTPYSCTMAWPALTHDSWSMLPIELDSATRLETCVARVARPRKSGSYARPDSLLSCPLNVICDCFYSKSLSSIRFRVHILVPGLRMRAQPELVHDVLI